MSLPGISDKYINISGKEENKKVRDRNVNEKNKIRLAARVVTTTENYYGDLYFGCI